MTFLTSVFTAINYCDVCRKQSLLLKFNVYQLQHRRSIVCFSLLASSLHTGFILRAPLGVFLGFSVCNDCPQVFHVDLSHIVLLWQCTPSMRLSDWGLKILLRMIMSEEERDSCQLTELSAIERVNVESDDKAAPFSVFAVLILICQYWPWVL